MPKLTRKTSHVDARKPFGVYDGPEPDPGTYLGVIRSVGLRTFDSGTQAINVLVELEAKPESPAKKYDGYPAWTKLFLGEHEAQIARENSFYQAVSGKSDVDVVFDDKSDKKEPPITKIGGVSPVGKKVRVQLKLGNEYQGRRSIEGDSIYPADVVKAGPVTPQGDPDADPDEPAVEISASGRATSDKGDANPDHDGPTGEVAPAVDHHALSLPALRKHAASLGIDSKLKKAELLAALDEMAGTEVADGGTIGKPSNATDAAKFTAEELVAFFGDEYEDGDLDGMSKEELIEEFVESELITSF